MATGLRERTYGNWRRPRSAGIGRLGLLGTGVLMGGIIVVILLILWLVGGLGTYPGHV